MGRACFIVMEVLCSTAAAHATPIPTFNLGQGTLNVAASYTGSPVSLSWAFSGPNGAFAGGIGDGFGGCFSGGIPGDICAPSLTISALGPNIGSAFGAGLGNSGNQVYFYGSGISISGSTFTLPDPSVGTFNITMPVVFSGSLIACPLDLTTFDCGSSAPIGVFNVNGKGTAALTFSNGGSFPFWLLTNSTYTLNPTPEPSTLTLLGTGALALVGRFVRQRRKVRVRGC